MKKHIGIILIGFFSGVFITALILLGISHLEVWKNEIKMEAVQMAINTIVNTAEKEGTISFERLNEKGEKVVTKLNLEKNIDQK